MYYNTWPPVKDTTRAPGYACKGTGMQPERLGFREKLPVPLPWNEEQIEIINFHLCRQLRASDLRIIPDRICLDGHMLNLACQRIRWDYDMY